MEIYKKKKTEANTHTKINTADLDTHNQSVNQSFNQSISQSNTVTVVSTAFRVPTNRACMT